MTRPEAQAAPPDARPPADGLRTWIGENAMRWDQYPHGTTVVDAEALDAFIALAAAAPTDHDCLLPSACGVTGFYCSNTRPAVASEALDPDRLTAIIESRMSRELAFLDDDGKTVSMLGPEQSGAALAHLYQTGDVVSGLPALTASPSAAPDPADAWQQGYEACWKRLHEPDALALDVERLARAINECWALLLAPGGGTVPGLRLSAAAIAAAYSEEGAG